MHKRNDFNIDNFKRRLEAKLSVIPQKMGMLAADHFDKSFRNQGFTDTTLQPWQKTKSGKSNTFSRQSRGILIGRGRLRRGTRRAALSYNMVRLVNDVTYASVHNEGFKGVVQVPAHTRRQSFKYSYGNKKAVKEVKVSAHAMRMNIPRRRFMGRSIALTSEIRRMIIREIKTI